MSLGRQTATSIRSSGTPSSIDKALDGHAGSSTSPITIPQYWATKFPEQNLLTACAGVSGAISALVSCPLDVIKTKLQAQGGFRISKPTLNVGTTAYHGVSGTAATIWKEEGARGMYRGLGPMLLGYIPTWAIFLTVYDSTQSFLRTKTGKSQTTLILVSEC